jgi:OmpA-OmpF porin, OOP family
MKLWILIAISLLSLASNGLWSRSAASVVLGDSGGTWDCPAPTPEPTPLPTATPIPLEPTPEPTPNPLKQDIENLGFPVQWEGDVMLVTLADEKTRFDTAQATLKPDSILRLDALAAVLLRYPGNRIRVDGHTDSAGKAAFNQKLSLRRAEAVRDALQAKGVPDADFESVSGHGPDLPVGDNATEEGRALNRRVELRLRFHGLQMQDEGGQWLTPIP